MSLPHLGPDDVVELIREAQAIGTVEWITQLPDWFARVIRPRLTGGD